VFLASPVRAPVTTVFALPVTGDPVTTAALQPLVIAEFVHARNVTVADDPFAFTVEDNVADVPAIAEAVGFVTDGAASYVKRMLLLEI
jgi:hypothetical protein